MNKPDVIPNIIPQVSGKPRLNVISLTIGPREVPKRAGKRCFEKGFFITFAYA